MDLKLKTQLKVLLDKHGLTAAQLSRKSGVPKQIISDYLAGSSPRKLEHVKAIADQFNLTLDDLLFGETKSTTSNSSMGLEDLLTDQWIGGSFEVKIRRIKSK